MPAGRYLITVVAFLAVAATPAPPQAVRLGSSSAFVRGQENAFESLVARPARLTIETVPLTVALTELRYDSGVMLVFSPSMLPPDTVSCACGGLTVGDALEQLLRGTSFDYVESGRQVVIGPSASPLPADAFPALASAGPRGSMGMLPLNSNIVQEGTIAGQVVEANTQRPLAGAQVSVPGTGIGALTNSEGRYRLASVPAGEVAVRVQMIGYATEDQTITLSNGQSVALDFALSQQALALDEIVVTGTAGGTERRAIGHTVTQVDAGEVVESAAISTASDLIRGRAPGVHVRMPSQPGAGAILKLRGSSSVAFDDAPLIIIDGVRVDNAQGMGGSTGYMTSRFEDVNPAAIESIEIIKGPAASTLYGTEAAGGVIHIITKRGIPGETQYEMSVRQGVTWIPRGVLDRYPTRWQRDPETGELVSGSLIRSERRRGNPVYRTGWQQEYNLQASGGSSQLRFFTGLHYSQREGVEPTSNSSHFSGRMNLSFAEGENLDVSASTGVNVLRTNLAHIQSSRSSVGAQLYRTHPLLLETPRRGWFGLPPEVIWSRQISQDVNKVTTSIQANHRPSGWFTQRLSIGLDISDVSDSDLRPLPEPEHLQFLVGEDRLGGIDISDTRTFTTSLDYGATASYELGDGLAASTSVGLQYYRRLRDFETLSGAEFPGPGLVTVGAAAVRTSSQDFVETSSVGVYLQEEFSISDRIFVTGALRADDHSAFGEDFTFSLYPKIGLSWVVSDEPFWNVDAINQLRLRGAFGAAGRQPDDFAALRLYRPVTGTGDQPAVLPDAFGNPDLAPERGEELELGFETSLFSNRIGLGLTYYNQRTRDAIVARSTPPSSGFAGTTFVNAGEILNTGLELAINARPTGTLDINLSVATNHNEIVHLGDLPSIIRSAHIGGVRDVPGYPVGSFFTKRVVSAEMLPDGTTTNLMCDGGPENNDQPLPCDDAPVLYMGNPNYPTLQGSFGVTWRFLDDLQLSGLVDFERGRTKFFQGEWVSCTSYRICRANWVPEEFDPAYVAEVQRASSAPLASSWFHRADFAKLRELSLNYQVPERFLAGLGADGATVSLAARNLLTWTEYPAVDPETGRRDRGRPGQDQGPTAVPAQFVTTVRLRF